MTARIGKENKIELKELRIFGIAGQQPGDQPRAVRMTGTILIYEVLDAPDRSSCDRSKKNEKGEVSNRP
jgi:hypothetical protein